MLNSSLPALLVRGKVAVLLAPDEPCARSPAEASALLVSSEWPDPVPSGVLADLAAAAEAGVSQVCLANFEVPHPDELAHFVKAERPSQHVMQTGETAFGIVLLSALLVAMSTHDVHPPRGAA